jgi:hypothetical protein
VTDDASESGRESEWEDREAEAAANAAGAIGGRAGDEDVDPAERPLQEAGEGEAEGFELAEQDLVESAESGTRTDPLRDRFPAESEGAEQVYGEADHERSSERRDDEDD